MGDPGLGKSQMLSSTVKIAPRGVYVCGNTASTAGLTVTLSKDHETGDTSLEAGALVLSDQGFAAPLNKRFKEYAASMSWTK